MSALIFEFLLDVSKGAEGPARTIARRDHVITLGGLVDLRVKLLLGARVTVFTRVAVLAHGRLQPVIALLHIGTRRRPVLEHAGVATLVSHVVVLRTRKTLATEARRPLALLRFVVD